MLSSLTASFLTPDEVVSRLEEAQCVSPQAAGKILREVAPRLMRVHPKVTEAALTVLEIHPHETVPHIPDLISDSPQDTSTVLDLFSELLQIDRTLLVPVIATLPELALTSAHVLHARSTLSFALSVVDEEDLPTVIRALLRSADNHASAEWAARVVRAGLSRSTLKSSLAPLLVHVLEEFLRSSSTIARALRAQAGTPFLLLDLFVWVLSFSPRLASPLPAREARASLRVALSIGMLSYAARIREYIALAAPALTSMPDAVHRFAIEILVACPLRFSDISGCIHLIHALIIACPDSWEPIVLDLASDSRHASKLVLRAILNLFKVSFQPRAISVRCHALVCQNIEDSDSALADPARNQLLIKVRKSLLFGQDGDKREAIEMAADVVQNAPRTTVREIMSILHNSVPYSLADPIAIDLLLLYVRAVLCGAIDQNFAKSFFETRVSLQCPDGFYEEESDNDAQLIGIRDAVAIKIDVGLIWNQAPTATAAVASALVLSLGYQRCIGAIQNLPFHALNVTVLVPVNCLSLYQAVDHINSTSTLVPSKFGRLGTCGVAIEYTELPEEVLELTDGDLSQAVSAFGTGIAAIIGILNTACGSLDQCSRVLNRRSTGTNDVQESADHRVNWALLERLTELHRMLNAMTLGHELISKRCSGSNAPTHRKRRRDGMKTAQNGDSPSLDAKSQSYTVVSNTNAALFGSFDSMSQYNQQTNSSQRRFPHLSLKSVISAIAAIPDESEMLASEVSCVKDRDIELVGMDKFLLRLLLRSVLEVDTSNSKRLMSSKRSTPPEDQDLCCGPVSVIAKQAFREFDVGRKNDVGSLFEHLGKALDENQDIFFVSDDIGVSCNSEPLETLDACDVRWAHGGLLLKESIMEYLTDGISKLSKRSTSEIYALDLLHSPAFAALLLDRAATATSVSRNAREQTASNENLKDLISVSGLALSCLGHILRNLPTYLEQYLVIDSVNGIETTCNPWEDIRQFAEKMNCNILTHLPKDFTNDEQCFSFQGDDIDRFSRLFETLEWIRVTTVDSTVAMCAAEVVMIFSELDIWPSADARRVVFLSLSTVYEFDNGSMWNPEDFSMVTKDPFHDWLVRRRGRVNLSSMGNLNELFECGESPPWVELKKRPAKSNSVEHLRLLMYFCGMHVTSAVEEGCGWVREFSQVLISNAREMGRSVVECSPASKGNLNSSSFKIVVQAQRFQICDILLDMIGFRTILLTLLDLANHSLTSYSIDESLLPSEAHDRSKSPLYTINMTIRLISGILTLYFRNRQALLSMTSAENVKIDELLEKEVITGCVAVMQKVHRRIEELHQWYSNESLQVCDLVQDSIEQLHQIIGGAIVTVAGCVQFAESLRSTLIDKEAEPEKGLSKSTDRKIPGYVKHKERKGYLEKRLRDFSIKRKLIPRLSIICEQVGKGAEQFARSLGVKRNVKLSSLAAESIISDEKFHFGSGINGGVTEIDGNERFNDVNDDKTDVDDSIVDTGHAGFHVRGVYENDDRQTISVRFR